MLSHTAVVVALTALSGNPHFAGKSGCFPDLGVMNAQLDARIAESKRRFAAIERRVAASRVQEAQLWAELREQDVQFKALLDEILPLAHKVRAEEARKRAKAAGKAPQPGPNRP